MNNTMRTAVGPLSLAPLFIALCLAGCAVTDKTEVTGTAGKAGNGTAAAAKPYVWSKSMEAKRVAVEQATRDSGIAVLRTQDNQLQINVPSDFSFDTDSAAIKPGMRPVLDQIAEDLETAGLAQMLILIVGHTDSRGPDAVNDALSLSRAVNVRKYIEGKGVATGRISVEGRGEHQPLVDNDKGYGRALNRRVEIFLREPAA